MTQLTRVEKEALAASRDPVLIKMLEEERIESKDVDWRLFLKLLRYLKPHTGLATVAVLLSTVESVLMTMPAYVIGVGVDSVQEGARRSEQIFDPALELIATALSELGTDDSRVTMIVAYGVILLVVWSLRWVLAIGTTYLIQMLGQRVVHDLRVDVYNHISGQGLEFFHANPVGRLVNRTTFDVQALSELFSDAFAQGFRDLLFVIVLCAVMLSLDLPLAATIMASFPLLIAVALLYRALARPSLRTMSAVQSRMNGWLAENIAGMRENQLYRREDQRRAEWRSLTNAHQASIYRVIQAWAVLRPGMMIVSAIATTAVLVMGYGRVSAGIISIGVLITFLEYTNRVWVPVRNLAEKFNVIQNALTAGERVFHVLETPRTLSDLPNANPDIRVEKGAIEFTDVTFRYPRTSEDVLNGISFKAEPGQMVALVGNTGAGKSTIVNLISRFYDVQSGVVKVDGHDVRDFLLENLRGGIALIPQDVVIFAGTLRENITLGAEYSDAAVISALEAVSGGSILRRQAAGLDQILEEGGKTLSAGERQLISFARALLVNPPVLILDEATASVDSRTEALIQEALSRLTKGRTTIVIAHRLSTIRDADHILVLRHGEVVESGTHDSLLRHDGEYAKLYRSYVSEARIT